MWKTLLKGRHARQGDIKNRAPSGVSGPPPPPKVGKQAFSPAHETSYNSTGPAVDYSASAPPEQYQGTQSSCSPWAVDYDRTAPTPQISIAPMESATPFAVEYHRSAPTPAGGPSGEYVSSAGDYPRRVENSQSPEWRGPAEPRVLSLQEMPASPVPYRYELPVDSPARQPTPDPPYPPSVLGQTPPSGRPYGSPTQAQREWEVRTLQTYQTPPPSASTNPTPPPTYRKSSNGAPTPSATRSAKGHMSGVGIQPGTVSKFTAKVFCQRKSTSKSAHPILETPRDISEFRLAKIALIPVVAGERSFVSIDIVFGEVDRGISGLLEKHFLVAQNTAIISTHITHGGATASNVCKLANLRVAYETHISALYIVFEKNEDWQRFATEFDSVKHLAEATEN